MIKALVVAALIWPAAAVAQTVPEPTEYRTDHYRGPVPATLNGAIVIGPEEAHDLWVSGVAGFVDVLPQPPKPANLPKGTIWRDKARNTIPGALWMPNVGYGAIADVTAAYFRAGLEAATSGDKDRPVVIFCLEDCWMSWNAAKRAVEWGYGAVYWLPEGSDGWALWGYPLDRATPYPGQPQSE